jgi:hypothetical protein
VGTPSQFSLFWNWWKTFFCRAVGVERSSACHLWGHGFDSGTHSSCDREGDSLWRRRFSPGLCFRTLHYKVPNIVYRGLAVTSCNNVIDWHRPYWRYFFCAVQDVLMEITLENGRK